MKQSGNLRFWLLQGEDPAGKWAAFERQNHAFSPAPHSYKVSIAPTPQGGVQNHVWDGGPWSPDPAEGLGTPELIEEFDLFDGIERNLGAGMEGGQLLPE